MERDKALETLVNALAVHQIMILSLISLLQHSDLTPQDYLETLKNNLHYYESYKTNLWGAVQNPERQSERQLWDAIGLGDLWRPTSEDKGER